MLNVSNMNIFKLDILVLLYFSKYSIIHAIIKMINNNIKIINPIIAYLFIVLHITIFAKYNGLSSGKKSTSSSCKPYSYQ